MKKIVKSNDNLGIDKKLQSQTEQGLPFTRAYVVGLSDILGIKGKEQIVKVPKMCSYNILIKQIACGPKHTHMLTQDGFVYSMGFNHSGVLGLSQTEQDLKHTSLP